MLRLYEMESESLELDSGATLKELIASRKRKRNKDGANYMDTSCIMGSIAELERLFSQAGKT